MFTVKISSKGQIAIPAVLRKRLHLEQGDRLIVKEHEGSLLLEPIARHPLLDLKGDYYKDKMETMTSMLVRERNADRKKEK